MLKKPLIKKTSPVQSGIKQAYELVAQDLFKSLKKAKDSTKIKFGECGTFHKKRTKIHSSLDGHTYLYYRISFKISDTLKKELD